MMKDDNNLQSPFLSNRKNNVLEKVVVEFPFFYIFIVFIHILLKTHSFLLKPQRVWWSADPRSAVALCYQIATSTHNSVHNCTTVYGAMVKDSEAGHNEQLWAVR